MKRYQNINSPSQPPSRRQREGNTAAILEAIKTGRIIPDPNTGTIIGPAGKELKPRINFFGYPIVQFKVNGIQTSAFVHKLIWLSVNGSIPPEYEIDHISGDKSDPRISNLQLLHWRTNMAKTKRSYTPAQVAF